MLRRTLSRRPRGRPPYPGTFTPAEQRVLAGLQKGHTYQRIADDLGLSYDTVKYHVSNMLAKAEVERREELVTFAAQPGLRWSAVPIALAWVGGAAAAVALVAFAVLVLLNRGGDDEPAAPDATPTVAATPTMVGLQPTVAGTALAPSVTTLTQISVPAAGAVPGGEGWGLVLGNRLTGGAEVWLMPRETDVRGISPSGRYFVWEWEIVDGWTGQRTPIARSSGQISVASFSPDDQFVYVQDSSHRGRVVRIDGSEIVRLPDTGATEPYAASQRDIVWTLDGAALAVQRPAANSGMRVDVAIRGTVQAPIERGGTASWSNSGRRLAVSGREPVIIDYDAGTTTPLEGEGDLPAWSEDDRYVALSISEGQVPGLAVFDSASGKELVRVLNPVACFDTHWSDQALLLGWGEQALQMPGAGLVPIPDGAQRSDFPWLGSGPGGITWSDGSGVYASVQVNAIWASSFSWLRRDIDGFPPALFLGRSGKGACAGETPAPIIELPPFG